MGILAAHEGTLAGFDEQPLARRREGDVNPGRPVIARALRALIVTVAMLLLAWHRDAGSA